MGFERNVVLNAPIEKVWARVVSPDGINHEMRPWLTMSFPRDAGATTTIEDVPLGEQLGRVWLRLFGVVPFDYDHLMIAELEPGAWFREESTMLSMKRWAHERILTSLPDGRTEVRDRIAFEPRVLLRPASFVLARLLPAFFEHRHRKLQRYFG